MALYEERSSHGNSYWQTRLQRERLNISESVEETLADVSSLEQWSDEEQQCVPIDRDSTSSRTDVVPPRISLQSNVLPSVRPPSFVQSVTSEIAAQKAAMQEKEGSRKPQNTNILARFAQRFTSSIAAIMQPDIATWEPTQREQQENFQERHLTPLPPHAITPVEGIQKPTVIDAIPATSSQPVVPPVKSKQRLAGHTAKVQLQNAPTSTAVSRPEGEGDIYAWNGGEPLREPLTVNVRLREARHEFPQLTSTPHEELQAQQEKQINTSRASTGGCTVCFGKGTFERGQGELMVRDVRTTEASVVHITLTSNPGPTLVQYISLHPEVGFTLHLTAPAAVKTMFNYVLFVEKAL